MNGYEAGTFKLDLHFNVTYCAYILCSSISRDSFSNKVKKDRHDTFSDGKWILAPAKLARMSILQKLGGDKERREGEWLPRRSKQSVALFLKRFVRLLAAPVSCN